MIKLTKEQKEKIKELEIEEEELQAVEQKRYVKDLAEDDEYYEGLQEFYDGNFDNQYYSEEEIQEEEYDYPNYSEKEEESVEYLRRQESERKLRRKKEQEEKEKKIADELANELANKEYQEWFESEYGREEDWDFDDSDGYYYHENTSEPEDRQYEEEEAVDYDVDENAQEYENYLAEQEQQEYEEEYAELKKYSEEQRANIAFEKEGGSIISSVIGTWGGEVGRTLIEHYNDEKSALKVSEIGCISELHQTINETIKNKPKKKRTQELQIFENYDEYDKHIINTRNIDCAYLWRNKSWNFLDWVFEYDQNDFGVDILEDEYLPILVLSSTSLKKEINQSKFIKNFTNLNDSKWEILSEKFTGKLDEILDQIPF